MMKNISLWLQTIIEERFNIRVEISDSDGFWVLKNDTLYMEIKKNIIFYKLGSMESECQFWDASAEGYKNPLNKPLVFIGNRLPNKMTEEKSNKVIIHFDILGLTYWYLSRAEEIDRADLDEHNRFSAKHSHAYKHGYLERPIVDEWLGILSQVIEEYYPDITLNTPQFLVKVSHDVDAPSQFGFVGLRRFIRRCGASLLLDKNIKNIILAPFVALFTQHKLLNVDAYNSFDWIMSLSEKYGLKSAFYFICGCTDKHKDADYELNHPAIRHLMKNIYHRGHEIGLHPSYHTYLDKNLIQSEFNSLKEACDQEEILQSYFGGRMHYLRWKHPYTMQAWNDVGLNYDSTMTYADHAGFRCGTCFEYPAINPITYEILNLRFRPLIAMECSVISNQYMGLGTGVMAKEKFLELAHSCRMVGGCFTMLWHNSEFSSKRKKRLYEDILKNLCA